jgi:predicted glutamine amidotransferase
VHFSLKFYFFIFQSLDVEKCERKSLKNIGEKKCSMTFHPLKKNNLDIDELSFRESCFSITMRSHDYTWNFLYPTTFEYSAAVIVSLKLKDKNVWNAVQIVFFKFFCLK